MDANWVLRVNKGLVAPYNRPPCNKPVLLLLQKRLFLPVQVCELQ